RAPVGAHPAAPAAAQRVAATAPHGRPAGAAGGHARVVPLGLAAGREGRHLPAGGQDDDQREVPLGDVALDEHRAVTGRGLPVDVADVVADGVLTQVVEVHGPPLVDRGVAAVEQRDRAAPDVDRQLALDLVHEGGHDGPYGVRTPRTTASMIVSTRTSSAVAS